MDHSERSIDSSLKSGVTENVLSSAPMARIACLIEALKWHDCRRTCLVDPLSSPGRIWILVRLLNSPKYSYSSSLTKGDFCMLFGRIGLGGSVSGGLRDCSLAYPSHLMPNLIHLRQAGLSSPHFTRRFLRAYLVGNWVPSCKAMKCLLAGDTTTP